MPTKVLYCQCCGDYYPNDECGDHGFTEEPSKSNPSPQFMCEECDETFDKPEDAERCELKHTEDAEKES